MSPLGTPVFEMLRFLSLPPSPSATDAKVTEEFGAALVEVMVEYNAITAEGGGITPTSKKEGEPPDLIALLALEVKQYATLAKVPHLLLAQCAKVLDA